MTGRHAKRGVSHFVPLYPQPLVVDHRDAVPAPVPAAVDPIAEAWSQVRAAERRRFVRQHPLLAAAIIRHLEGATS